MLFESAHYVGGDNAMLYCELLECYWKSTEKLKIAIVYTLLCHLKHVWFYVFFHWKKLKNIHVTLSIPLHEHFFEFLLFSTEK